MRYRALKMISRAAISVLVATMLLLSAFPLIEITFVKAIDNAEDLATALAQGDNIELTADITIQSWEVPSSYSGQLNGNGHIISGLSTALIGELTGSVTDLGVSGTVFSDDQAMLAESVNGGKVTGCFAYGSISYTGKDAVGGLVGTMTAGTVEESFACVQITTDTAAYTGGLIGKITDGSVDSCYSSGWIKAPGGTVAGLANLLGGQATDTYTSCQLVNTNSHAKPSGVNGLYDNQLSIMRESLENTGIPTRTLITASGLSSSFAVTSTAYPALQRFYGDAWSGSVADIVRVSVAAAAFSDKDAAVRMEPEGFEARADYLTYDTYMDRTNSFDLAWSINSDVCKVYDTVPVTTVSTVGNMTAGTVDDLLRARLVFSESVSDAVLTASSGGYKREWYLGAYAANPYFADGNGATDAVFEITNKEQLSHVRYYSLIAPLNYIITENIVCGRWDPIDAFSGTLNGGGKTLSSLTVVDDGAVSLGLIGTAQKDATITDLTLCNVSITANEGGTPTVGALIGEAASGLKVSKVMLSGTENVLQTDGIAGGLIGKAVYAELEHLLVSVEAVGETTCGGIVGVLDSGSLIQSGVTGSIFGDGTVGGVIGIAQNGALAENVYSTAAVLTATDAENAVCGGLVGYNNESTLNTSYAASLVNVSSETAVSDPLVGQGTAATDSYFEGETLSAGDLVGESALEKLTTVWTKTTTHYPQITYFADTTRFSELSQLSTQPVYFQKYWPDAVSENMTTGWMAKSYSENGIFDKLEDLAFESVGNIYKIVEITDDGAPGWQFEAAGGSDYAAVRAQATGVGVRVAGATRPDMCALSYTVTRTENVTANAFIELYYTDDLNGSWQGSQVVSLYDGDETDDIALDAPTVLYDMPKGSYLKVRVRTADDVEVASVLVNGSEIVSTNSDGCYVSDVAYSEDVEVSITLQEATPKWGLRRENY